MRCFVNKCNFDHDGVKYRKSYRKYVSGFAISRRRKLFVSRKSRFRFHKRALNVKLIYSSPSFDKSKSQKCVSSSLAHVYKSLNDRINHSNFTLSRDVEKNPGPNTAIDPNKTISASIFSR